jgi:uncharacterized repeat protein (TIGR03803 family)
VYRVMVLSAVASLAACSTQSASLPGSAAATAPSYAAARLNPKVSFQLLYSFEGSPDAATPKAGLVEFGEKFYGTTAGGGTENQGAVFELTPSRAERVLHSFSNKNGDGFHPQGALVALGGVLYGTTTDGGANGAGTVYQIKTDGTEKVIYSFTAATGAAPLGDLVAVPGVLCGTTSRGGSSDKGTVYCVTLDGRQHVLLHNFAGGADGADPRAGLLYEDRHLYGTTFRGGALDKGTIFDIADKVERVLYSFKGDPSDGARPEAALTALGGVLYGTTARGGFGTLFSCTKQGDESLLHRFTMDQGTYPVAKPTAVNGVLYGTTSDGGITSDGTVYELAPGKSLRVLYKFKNEDGSKPLGALIPSGNALYGTTAAGGKHNRGTVFAITP